MKLLDDQPRDSCLAGARLSIKEKIGRFGSVQRWRQNLRHLSDLALPEREFVGDVLCGESFSILEESSSLFGLVEDFVD